MRKVEIEIPDGFHFDKTTMSIVKDEDTNTYIDLGFPSGTLWADRNVGADRPQDYGDYMTFDEAKDKAPKIGQLKELVENTNHVWCKIGDVQGYQFISKINGNHIFLPASGFCYEDSIYDDGTSGNYWLSTSCCGYASNAYTLYFNSENMDNESIRYRYFGFSVRQCKSK